MATAKQLPVPKYDCVLFFESQREVAPGETCALHALSMATVSLNKQHRTGTSDEIHLFRAQEFRIREPGEFQIVDVTIRGASLLAPRDADAPPLPAAVFSDNTFVGSVLWPVCSPRELTITVRNGGSAPAKFVARVAGQAVLKADVAKR